jgi:hypothetical protein
MWCYSSYTLLLCLYSMSPERYVEVRPVHTYATLIVKHVKIYTILSNGNVASDL